MAFLFGGGRRAVTENTKDFQRQINASGRGMEREVAKLDIQEKKILLEMKRMGQATCCCDQQGQGIDNLRAHRTRLSAMRAHLGQLSQQLQSVSGAQKIQDVVCQTTRMLQTLNKRYDPIQVSRMLQEFEKQNSMMVVKQEVLDDGLDEAFQVEGEITFAEDEVTRVMQEVGLDHDALLGHARIGCTTDQQDDTLASRLNLLQAGRA